MKLDNIVYRQQTPLFMAYMNDIRNYPIMTPDEEFNAFCDLRSGDINMREHIIRGNQRFVVSIAKQMSNNSNLIDAINEGNIGLMEAIDKFDHTKGFKFISFAIHNIRRRIREFVLYTSSTITPNKSLRVNKAKKIRETFFLKNGYEISDNELRQELGAAHFYDVNKLNKNITNEFDDLTSSSSFNLVNENIDNEHYIHTIENLLKNLKDRDRKIITLYYGLNGVVPHTIREISDITGISVERVRQIKAGVLIRLKRIHQKQNIAI